MMREIFRYSGRPRTVDDTCYKIECEKGRVLAVTEVYGKVEFVVAYCRAAIIDRWGVTCIDAFKQVSDASLKRTWSEPRKGGLTIFHQVRLHLTQEEDWMRRFR